MLVFNGEILDINNQSNYFDDNDYNWYDNEQSINHHLADCGKETISMDDELPL